MEDMSEDAIRLRDIGNVSASYPYMLVSRWIRGSFENLRDIYQGKGKHDDKYNGEHFGAGTTMESFMLMCIRKRFASIYCRSNYLSNVEIEYLG
jgi:hypothetical protein